MPQHSSVSQWPPARASRAKPVIREHKIPTPGSKPYIAVEGPDGNLWFCENGASKIGCFDPRAGTFREFALPFAELDAGRHRRWR